MIVVLGGIKGGSGKSTIATNLTVIRSSKGKKVLLVDADEQKTASDWIDQREGAGIKSNWTFIQLSGKSIYSQLEKLKEHYDDIIVDVGGRDTTSQRSTLTIADILIAPFRPKSADIWTLDSLKQMVNEISTVNKNLKCFAVINQADSVGSDNREALQVISEYEDIQCIPTTIGLRKSISNAFTDGLGILELKNADKKAVQEMMALYEFIYK